jgi:hypothetical protein
MSKCTRKNGRFKANLAFQKETNYFKSKLKHISNFVLANIGKVFKSFVGFQTDMQCQRCAMEYYLVIYRLNALAKCN